MNIFDDENGLPSDYGNVALMRQQGRLRDREADLREEMKAARAIQAPQGQMISGRYVAPSKLQQLGPVAAQLVAEVKKRGLERDQTGYDALEAQAAQQHLAAQPKDDAPATEKLAWAQRGAQIPALRSMSNDYINDLMVKAPERQEARVERKDARSQAIAEAQRKQQDELEYRRQRDADMIADRQQRAADSNDMRMTLHAAVRAVGSRGNGGVGAPPALENGEPAWKTVTNPKANEIIAKDNTDGTTTLVYKPTGETKVVGKIGRESAAITAERLSQDTKVKNAKDGLIEMDNIDALLKKATGSGIGAAVDKGYAMFGGSTPGADAARALTASANELASKLDRMPGAVSDADLMFIKGRLGDMGNPEVPNSQRQAAAKQVRERFNRILGAPTREATGKVDNLRGDLESAIGQHTAPAKPRMKFNPETGKLE